MNKVRIGLIGVGGIAQGAHLPALAENPDVEIAAICDVNPDTLKKVGEQYKVPENRRFADYRGLIACPDVDAVEVCTPNNMHVPCAMAAVQAGKPVNVEKPLSLSCQAAQPLIDLLEKQPVVNMMCFSYRFRPAVRYARHLLEQGLLGDVVSVSVEYLKDSAFWEGRRLDWRFDKTIAGTGVLGDLGVHLIDMARCLLGEFREVSADCGTVVKTRKRLDSEEYAPVTTDDYCHFIARLGENSEIFANFTISRCCVGHTNTIRYDVYGTKGVLSFDLNNPDVLGVCVGPVDLECKNLHTVTVPAQYRDNAQAHAFRQEKTFVDAVLGRQSDLLPDIEEGMQCQRILDALLLSSEEKRWVKL
ncbi:MAG: Gfo/Idh/MocA family oxidoreductase [Eubacteriales bacterium]|nr:Gfo/Idh/MocA family oxidoreductase [Eubacteriales bacterium]